MTSGKDLPETLALVATPTSRRVAPQSTADEVAEVLRRQIQAGELSPDEWLREARVCTEFGVGRSIARRALRALEHDGLVVIKENRGARVSSTTVEEVFDLYELRAALYGLAARVACMRATDAEIKLLTREIDELHKQAEDGHPADELIRFSERIFARMIAHVSPDAQDMIAAVRRKTRFHFSYMALALNENTLGPHDFWADVRAALIARDANKAGQAAREILYFMQGEVARIMLSGGVGRRTGSAGAPRR